MAIPPLHHNGKRVLLGVTGGIAAYKSPDLVRRLIERGAELLSLRARDVLNSQPRRVSPDDLAVDAADLMEEHRITSVLVVDEAGRLVGALNSNDLMRAKVI